MRSSSASPQHHTPTSSPVEGELPGTTTRPEPANVSATNASLNDVLSAEISPRNEIKKAHLEQPVELSPALNLWDEAYRNLAEDKATSELVKEYVKVLFAHIGDTPLSSGVLTGESTSIEAVDQSAWVKDPILRQQKMRELLLSGQNKLATMIEAGQYVVNASGFLTSAKTMIDFAVENIPQAALPWAGVCVGLQVRERSIPPAYCSH